MVNVLSRLLIINPGSTSTKIAVFDDLKEIFSKTLRHDRDELRYNNTIFEQYSFRKSAIEKTLNNSEISLKSMNAIVARGGLLKPVEGGVYKVDDNVVSDLKKGIQGEHASNLGGVIAYDFANEYGCQGFPR